MLDVMTVEYSCTDMPLAHMLLILPVLLAANSLVDHYIWELSTFLSDLISQRYQPT